MMNILDEYFKENGVITNKEAEKLGVKRHKLAELVRKKKLERVKNGVYKKKDDLEDEFVRISCNNEKVVFSFHTALIILNKRSLILVLYVSRQHLEMKLNAMIEKERFVILFQKENVLINKYL